MYEQHAISVVGTVFMSPFFKQNLRILRQKASWINLPGAERIFFLSTSAHRLHQTTYEAYCNEFPVYRLL